MRLPSSIVVLASASPAARDFRHTHCVKMPPLESSRPTEIAAQVNWFTPGRFGATGRPPSQNSVPARNRGRHPCRGCIFRLTRSGTTTTLNTNSSARLGASVVSGAARRTDTQRLSAMRKGEGDQLAAGFLRTVVCCSRAAAAWTLSSAVPCHVGSESGCDARNRYVPIPARSVIADRDRGLSSGMRAGSNTQPPSARPPCTQKKASEIAS
jgi:hypothetical protein